MHLKRKGYQIYTGKIGTNEIDFVAEKEKHREYLQVAYLLPDEKVMKREFGNLELIKNNYPKYVITLDDINLGNRNGIIHKNAWEFID